MTGDGTGVGPRADAARPGARRRAGRAARRGKCLPRPIRRHDGVGLHSVGRDLDGRAAPARPRRHSREHHGHDAGLGGGGSGGGGYLHAAGSGAARRVGQLPVSLGHGHCRHRRHARRAADDPAAPRADRRAEAEVSRGHRGRRSAAGRRARRRRAEGSDHRRAARGRHQVRRDRIQALAWNGPGIELRRQRDRLSRHQPVAGAARHRLYRRAEHCHAGFRRQHDFLEYRDPDLLDMVRARRPRVRRQSCRRHPGG